jgi:hypothetical protein
MCAMHGETWMPVRRELSSLELCVCSLRQDFSGPKIQYPAFLEQNLIGALRNADTVAKEMQQLLYDMSSASYGEEYSGRSLAVRK